MQFYFFLDESGDHGMTKIDPNFPLLVLCGVLISEKKYHRLQEQIDQLKIELWGDTKVVFHSREIRRGEGSFRIFMDKHKKEYFLTEFNRIISESTFRIISAVVRKQEYKDKDRPNPLVGVYGHAFTFLVERCVFCLDEVGNNHSPNLTIIAESRGKDVDIALGRYLKTIKSDPRGTGFVPSHRLNKYAVSLKFAAKDANDVGLQVADLMAYPIARYALDRDRANPAFDVLEPRIYKSKENSIKGYGLKIFPE